MTIPVVLLVVMAALFACGIYLMLERSMTRVLLGFLLVGNGTNLLILIMAGRAGLAPIVTDGVTADEMFDPLPQALILTAIVITFAVSAFLMALIYRSWRLEREDDLDDDEDDVALRSGPRVILGEDRDTTTGDSEFAPVAEAPESNPDFDTVADGTEETVAAVAPTLPPAETAEPDDRIVK